MTRWMFVNHAKHVHNLELIIKIIYRENYFQSDALVAPPGGTQGDLVLVPNEALTQDLKYIKPKYINENS